MNEESVFSWSDADFDTKAAAAISAATESMAPYNAFDVLANLWFEMVVTASDGPSQDALLPLLEQAVEILRHRPSPQGDRERDVAVSNQTTQEWFAQLRTLFELASFRGMNREVSPRQEDGLGDQFFHLHMQELTIRNRSYAHQERETIRDLFGPSAGGPALKELVGFDGADAIELMKRVGALTEERLDRWRTDARQLADELRAEGFALESSSAQGDASPSPSSDEVDAATKWAISIAWVGFGDRLLITAEELRDGTEVPLSSAQKFLAFFSVEFGAPGEIVPLWRHVENVPRYRPVVFDGIDRYFVTSYDSLLWAIRPRLERELKPKLAGETTWQAFREKRTEYVESRALKSLTRAVRATTVLRNVTYLSNGVRREVDGLIIVDSIAIIVEAKSASLRGSSRAGNAEHLDEDLVEMLGKATSQLDFLRSAITAGGRLTFRNEKKKEVGTLLCEKIAGIFAIAVTLEDLNWLSSDLWELFDRGVVVRSPPPLLMNIHDLEVICEICEFPCQVLQYFSQRAKMSARRIFSASDELEYFAQYIRAGIDPDGFEQYVADRMEKDDDTNDRGPTIITLGMGTEELDQYYYGVEGSGPVTAKPRRPLPDEVREILEILEKERPQQFLSASSLFLELNSEAQEQFASLVVRLRLLSADGRFHDGRVNAGDFGITVMIAPQRQAADLGPKLKWWCRLRKYQTKSKRWLGLGFVSESPQTLSHYIFVDREWMPDADLDSLLDARREPKPVW